LLSSPASPTTSCRYVSQERPGGRSSIIVALTFFVVILISIVAAYLYGVVFVNAVAADTSEPFYRQPFVWGVAAIALALAALLTSLLRR
jgi:hypothetical protein